MEDKTPSASAKPAGAKSGRGGILIGGTLIILLAGGITMQVWRARDGIAAEQKATSQQIPSATEALKTAFARVNGESITYEALAKECVERHGKEVLDSLINRMIIQQECANRGLTVSEAEVDQEIVEISKKFGLAVDQWYKMLEAERNLTPAQYRRDVIWPMLALKKLAGKEVKITREMMAAAYEDNYGPRREGSHDRDRQHSSRDGDLGKGQGESGRVRSTGTRLLNRTQQPGTWRRDSTDSKEQRHPDNLRKAAFALKEEGELSGIVQVEPNRFAILKFEGRTEPVDHNLADVEAQLHADLTEREVQKMVGETFERLQQQARVDNFLTGESRGRTETAAVSDDAAAPAQK